MQAMTRKALLVLIISGLAIGCVDSISGNQCPCKKEAGIPEESNAISGPGERRKMLNDGYSMLHTDAGHIHMSVLVLYAKSESESFEKIVKSISSFGGELANDLEEISKNYPGVLINKTPLPEIELRKRRAIANERARYFAPGIGHGGREYERTLLIGFSNAINHQRYLCRVMASEEPDVNLKKFLTTTGARYDAIHERIIAVLEQEHFQDPNGKTADQSSSETGRN